MAHRRYTPNKLDQGDEQSFLDGLDKGRKSLLMVTDRYEFSHPAYKDASELIIRMVKLAGEVSGDSQALLTPAAQITWKVGLGSPDR